MHKRRCGGSNKRKFIALHRTFFAISNRAENLCYQNETDK